MTRGNVNWVRVFLPSSRKSVDVPVHADDGTVALERFRQDIDRNPNKALNDYDRRADVLLPANATPRQIAAWLADSDNADIEGLDVRGRPLHNLGARKGENRNIHKKVDFYGIPEQEVEARRIFDESFSPDDRRKLISGGGLSIEARPLKAGIGGQHFPGKNAIALKRNGCLTNHVMVHEGVHHLREVDGARNSPITKKRKDHCVEESCTVAESMARVKEFQVDGYYLHVRVKDPETGRYRNPTYDEAKKMAMEDRRLFTNGTGKALQGDAAIASVEEHWKDSNIARLRLKGEPQAIRTMAAAHPELNLLPVKKKNAPRKSASQTKPRQIKKPRPATEYSKIAKSAPKKSAKRKTSGR